MPATNRTRMEAHIVFCFLGTACAGMAVYAALTGYPVAAAIATAVAYFAMYRDTPTNLRPEPSQ